MAAAAAPIADFAAFAHLSSGRPEPGSAQSSSLFDLLPMPRHYASMVCMCDLILFSDNVINLVFNKVGATSDKYFF